MDLKSIQNDRAKATAVYMGESIEFGYRPAMVTPTTYNKLSEAKSVEEIKEYFSQLIVWWDITDKGKRIPVSEDTIANLPMPLITAFAYAVMRDVPERDAGKDSAAS